MWNDKCLLFLFREEAGFSLVDLSGQDNKQLLKIQKEEVFSEDSDYSYMEEKTLEISFNGAVFAEINFSDEFGSSYFGLDLLNKSSSGNY